MTDNDVGVCQPKQYDAFFTSFESEHQHQLRLPTRLVPAASPGQTLTFSVEVSGNGGRRSGRSSGPFGDRRVVQHNGVFEQLFGQFTFNLQAPSGCFVSKAKELMITNTSVVDDPIRTVGDGPWSFGHMLRQLAPTPDQAPAFALQLFQHWLTEPDGQRLHGRGAARGPAADPGRLAEDGRRAISISIRRR